VNILVINHHFVTSTIYDRGIYPIDPKQLDANIDALHSTGWSAISLDDLSELRSLNQQKDYFLLTFDDGLLCHYQTVRPLLDRHGISGVFFVPTCILLGEPVTTHQFQYIRTTASDVELTDWLFGRLPEFAKVSMDQNSLISQYPYDEPEAAELKYLLNFVLPSELQRSIIKELFIEYCRGTEFFSETYMNQDQIAALAEQHSIGSHGHSHRPLALLEDDDLRNELDLSKEILESLLGKKVDSISFPYGSLSAVSSDVFTSASEAEYRFGFSMVRGLNTMRDVETQPLSLKRINVNELAKWMMG